MYKKFVTLAKEIKRSGRPTFRPEFANEDERQLARAHLRYHDHGVLRGRWTNLEEISTDVWRSNQPNPEQIAQYADRGIQTILSLRGTGNSSHYLLEKEACAAHGIKLLSLGLSAKKAAPKEIYLALLDQFETMERPFLFHCKSGADRTGLAAAFYLLHIDNAPVSVARKQLGLKYLHFRWFKSGILDAVLDAYNAHLDKSGPTSLRDWLKHYYDAKQITQHFQK
ncbi:MAG: tyrosine-protein phosphatase [Rhodobacteraceae bacterium]|nr:tyrosine-protein phosphatase [Paracoccaceae bacterium]